MAAVGKRMRKLSMFKSIGVVAVTMALSGLWASGAQAQSGSPQPTPGVEATQVNLEYQKPNSQWASISDKLYVPAGASVSFRLTGSPTNVVWGGTSGASGTGTSTSATFSTISASMSDTKSVTVNYKVGTTDSSGSANVVAHGSSSGTVTLDDSQISNTGEVYAQVNWNCWADDANSDYIADNPTGGSLDFTSLPDWNDLSEAYQYPDRDTTVTKLTWNFVSGKAGSRNITMVDGIVVANTAGQTSVNDDGYSLAKAPTRTSIKGRYALQFQPYTKTSAQIDPLTRGAIVAGLRNAAGEGAKQALDSARTTIGNVQATIIGGSTVPASNPAVPAGSDNSVSVVMATGASVSGNNAALWWTNSPELSISVLANPGTIKVGEVNYPCWIATLIFNRYNPDKGLRLSSAKGWGRTFQTSDGVAAPNRKVYGLDKGRTHFAAYYYGQQWSGGKWTFGSTKSVGLNGVVDYIHNPYRLTNQLQNGQQIVWPQ